MSYQVTQGQLDPIEVRPFYPSGKVAPLAGVTTVRFVVELNGNPHIDVTSPSIALAWDNDSCIITYTPQAGETDTAGTLEIYVFLDGVRYPGVGSVAGEIVAA